LVNSSGGRTDSIWQIIEAMKGCRGDVSVTVIGAAYSAASMLACMAPECYIADSAEFMLHTAHYGSIGTVPNVKGQTEFATRQINKLLDQAYKGFLTDKELEELKNGKEFWFDSEEAGKRMVKRYKYLKGLSNPKPKKVKVEVE
jgi:ATP-dependent protease ClpP protease subunit